MNLATITVSGHANTRFYQRFARKLQVTDQAQATAILYDAIRHSRPVTRKRARQMERKYERSARGRLGILLNRENGISVKVVLVIVETTLVTVFADDRK